VTAVLVASALAALVGYGVGYLRGLRDSDHIMEVVE
jgi:hypothetical protein